MIGSAREHCHPRGEEEEFCVKELMEFAKSATDETRSDALVDPENADGCFTSKSNRGLRYNSLVGVVSLFFFFFFFLHL